MLEANMLSAASGKPFTAFQVRVNTTSVLSGARTCSACQHTNEFEGRPQTSVGVSGGAPPALIVLELPDAPRRTLAYDLEPTQEHTLTINGGFVGRYRLISVLYYARGYHYITDALDPREERWLRFDGNAAGGVAQPVEAPVGRMRHYSREYYPVMVSYVRTYSISDVPEDSE